MRSAWHRSKRDNIYIETGIVGRTARNTASVACWKIRECLSDDTSDVKDPNTDLVHLSFRSFRRRWIHLVQDDQFLPEPAYVVFDRTMTRYVE